MRIDGWLRSTAGLSSLAFGSSETDRTTPLMALATDPLVGRFSTVLGRVGGRARAVDGGFALAAELEKIVRAEGGPRALLYEPFPLFERLGMPLALRARGIDLVPVAQAGRQAADLGVGLTGAALGVVETASLLVGGRPGGWGLATILPRVHVVVLDIGDLIEHFDDAFARFAARFAAGEREWVWITGPSKTADIAKVLVTGIHGPNRLEVLVVDPGGGA